MASYRTTRGIAAAVAYATSLEVNASGLEAHYYTIYDAVLRQLLNFKPEKHSRFKEVMVLRPGVQWVEKTKDIWESNLVNTLATIGLTTKDLPIGTKLDTPQMQALVDKVQGRRREAEDRKRKLAGSKTAALKDGNSGGRLRPRDGLKQPSRGPELVVKKPFTAERIREVITSAISIRKVLDEVAENGIANVEKYLFPDFMVILVISALVKSDDDADDAQLQRDKQSANCEMLSHIPILIGEIKRHPGLESNTNVANSYHTERYTREAALQLAGYTSSLFQMFPKITEIALLTGIGLQYAIKSIARADVGYLLNGNLTFLHSGYAYLKRRHLAHWCDLVLGDKLYNLCSTDSHRNLSKFITNHIAPPINKPITLPKDVKQRLINQKQYKEILSSAHYNTHFDLSNFWETYIGSDEDSAASSEESDDGDDGDDDSDSSYHPSASETGSNADVSSDEWEDDDSDYNP